jgi:hypothetical protein
MIIDLQNIKKVYINLDRDVERKNRFENTLKELGYNNCNRFSARELRKIRAFNHGCSQSHHDLMEQYKENIPLFILEDDAKNTIWYDEYVIDGKIEVPDDADVLYLGYSTGGDWNTIGVNFLPLPVNEKWMRLQHCLGTHAMIFLNNSIQKFIENSKDTINKQIPLDVGYAKDVLPKLNVYAPIKSLFFQWDKCWPTTNVNCDPTNKTWTSYNLNNTINFIRHYTYETK